VALTASATFTVADSSAVSTSGQIIIQPPVGIGTGGKGRLIHPTVGTYDYLVRPTHTVNFDGEVAYPPVWRHTMTLGGGVDALWPGFIRDVEVIEHWATGEVGCPIDHLRMLWTLFANPPAVGVVPVIWVPNYASSAEFDVAIVDVTAGGKEYTLDRRLAEWGYAPQPVELKMRILARR
jgi:hypothetical protein